MVELIDLPPEVLVLMFEFLDGKSLIALTETCTKFHGIIESSERLTKKLTLHIRYPTDLNGLASSLAVSNRRYRNLKIVKPRDPADPDCNIPVSLLTKLGGMIKHLRIDWSNAMRPREAASLIELMGRRARIARHAGHFGVDFDGQARVEMGNFREDIYNEFFGLIRHFQNVETLSLFNVHLEKGRQMNDAELHYPNLQEFSLKQCDAYIFELLSSCNSLNSLEVHDPWWNGRNPGIDTFETFLISQISLKKLHLKNISYPRLFQTDRTENIIFKLDELVLSQVFFADKNIANRFFRTQNQLKKIEFQLNNERIRGLDEMQWYNDILRTVSSNSRLQEIKIEKLRYKIENYDFIANVVNPYVKKLTYHVTAEDKSSDLFKTFVRIFPNLEALDFKADENDETDSGSCFDEGTVLERVTSLVITNTSVRSLLNVHANSLMHFEYVPGKTGEFIDDLFGGFFHRQYVFCSQAFAQCFKNLVLILAETSNIW